MKFKTEKKSSGFTLVELMVAMAAASLLVLGSGTVLFHTYRSWSETYDKVHGDVATDGYVAKRAFAAAVRKSSVGAKEPIIADSGQSLEVYYYSSISSTKPDRYTRFYIQQAKLLADYGRLDSFTDLPTTAGRTVTLANNVNSVNFTITGTSVRMTLDLNDGNRDMLVACSALRHSE